MHGQSNNLQLNFCGHAQLCHYMCTCTKNFHGSNFRSLVRAVINPSKFSVIRYENVMHMHNIVIKGTNDRTVIIKFTSLVPYTWGREKGLGNPAHLACLLYGMEGEYHHIELRQ